MPTVVQLMDQSIADTFRKAKMLVAANEAEIGTEKFEYICHALDAVATAEPEYWLHAGVARRIVTERLAGWSTVEQWVKWEVALQDDVTPDNLQAYRLRWLDALAAEFDAKGGLKPKRKK